LDGCGVVGVIEATGLTATTKQQEQIDGQEERKDCQGIPYHLLS
jgi:hypothetical protein